jgi:glycosyltransferase involved in cell wall biosynthesis
MAGDCIDTDETQNLGVTAGNRPSKASGRWTKMRCLVVSEFYPPYIGGVERQTQLIARGLMRRGHEVHLATLWHANLPEHEDDNGVKIHRLRSWSSRVPGLVWHAGRFYHPPLPDPGIVWRLRRLIRQIQPSVIHAFGWIVYSCAVANLGTGVPLIISARDYSYICPMRTLLRENGEPCGGPEVWKCLRCATAQRGKLKGTASTIGVLGQRRWLNSAIAEVHSVSTYVRQVIQRDLVGREGRKPHNNYVRKLPVIPSGREPFEKQTYNQILDRLPNEPFILFVGALRPLKGVVDLLSAYRRLESPPPLVLIGTVWPDTPEHLFDQTIVLRDVPHAGVMAVWERALFGVFPSRWPEPFGNVVHEAMSEGKPVIGTAPGGMTDMIEHDVTGLLIPHGDVDALTNAMRRLIDDGALRDRLGAAARRKAQRYSMKVVLPQFEDLFREVAESFKPPEHTVR